MTTPGEAADPRLLRHGPMLDLLTVTTEADAVRWRRRLGTRSPEVAVLRGAATDGFKPRSTLEEPLVVSAGPLGPAQRHHLLLAAFALVADDLPDWRVRLLGSGARAASLRRLTHKLRLHDRVELPGDPVDLAHDTAAASISVCTSAREGLAAGLVEAMHVGVPAVAFDCPSAPRELIEHDGTGLLVPDGSTQALAAALLRLAGDAAARHRLGTAAREASRAWTASAAADRWEQLLRGATDRVRSGAAAAPGRTVPDDPGHQQASLSAPVDHVTPQDGREAAVRCVVEAAEATGVAWFVVPAHDEVMATVVVDASGQADLLARLVRAAVPDWLELVVDDPVLGARRGGVVEMARALARVPLTRFLVTPHDVDPRGDGARNHLAHDAGVRVELWPRRSGRLWAPHPNAWTRSVPVGTELAAITVEGVPARTLPEMVLPPATTCTFPVDAVYTWVDDTDPAWRERKRAHAPPDQARHRGPGGDARYVNRDELRHSLRSLHLYAPWIRRIHLVTAGQVPSWLEQSDRVRVVDHREILPASALPTFNSHAIETGLHRVPGLAEHYVYFNDDVLLNRPVRPEQLFSPDGRYAAFLTDAPIGLETDRPEAWRSGALNARRLLERDLGRTTTRQVAHTPHPQRRSVLEELERRYAEALEVTAHARFRSSSDLAVASSLVQYHGLMTGAAHLGELRHAWTQLRAHDLPQRLHRLLAREHDSFCLADHHHPVLPPQQVDRLVADMLRRHSPVVAPWERR